MLFLRQLFMYYDVTVWRYIGRRGATGSPTTTSSMRPTMPSLRRLDRDADPPKLLVIGPSSAGNLLEVIVLECPMNGSW